MITITLHEVILKMKTKKQRIRSNITVDRDTVRKAGVLASLKGMPTGHFVDDVIDGLYAAANLPELPGLPEKTPEAIAS